MLACATVANTFAMPVLIINSSLRPGQVGPLP